EALPLDSVVVKDTDAVWAKRQSWVWLERPVYANSYVRVFRCPERRGIGNLKTPFHRRDAETQRKRGEQESRIASWGDSWLWVAFERPRRVNSGSGGNGGASPSDDASIRRGSMFSSIAGRSSNRPAP